MLSDSNTTSTTPQTIQHTKYVNNNNYVIHTQSAEVHQLTRRCSFCIERVQPIFPKVGCAAVTCTSTAFSFILTTSAHIDCVTSGAVSTTSHYITPHHITSHHITPHHITSHHITPHHITHITTTSHNITPHHNHTLHHITPHYITSSHFTSPHITLHH